MTTLPKLRSATAFAPATCANVAVGFDIMGFTMEHVGDYVTLNLRDDNRIVIEAIDSQEPLPLEPEKNTASLVLQKLSKDLKLDYGFSLHIRKGIPLCSGMGGSAASAVAALIACNAFLEKPLSLKELIPYALLAEKQTSSYPHPDNVVPCLFGGLTLIQNTNPLVVHSLPVPDVYCALVHPQLLVPTEKARRILKPEVPLKDVVRQNANLAGFIASLYEKDLELLQKSLSDIIIEPQRAHFVPGFYRVKEAALQNGALGVSFSGSGPSMFALARDEETAKKICAAMQVALKQENVNSDAWVSKLSSTAAHLTESA